MFSNVLSDNAMSPLQFTEPSGVAVNAQNDIVVADTNNHRIQVFDKEGRFKFQFGECGKRDGQLLYPNRSVLFHFWMSIYFEVIPQNNKFD